MKFLYHQLKFLTVSFKMLNLYSLTFLRADAQMLTTKNIEVQMDSVSDPISQKNATFGFSLSKIARRAGGWIPHGYHIFFSARRKLQLFEKHCARKPKRSFR